MRWSTNSSNCDISICDIPSSRFCLCFKPVAGKVPVHLPKRAILVGQSLPPTFQPAEAILSCAPICAPVSNH